MPRPTRIEYPNAFYHVMNRGKGRQAIFYSHSYYEAFLDTLEQAHNRFDAIFHAYCLMGNHYHLLIETPRANLGRIMRHINGVYTQQYNRYRHTDGPLFRGRYKSILVDETAYLLQLSRYIHRNPIDTRRPLVTALEKYKWSSYPAYINKVPTPDWLYTNNIYSVLAQESQFVAYERYIAAGVDEELKRIYGENKTTSILGDAQFRNLVSKQHNNTKLNWDKALRPRPHMHKILEIVAKHYQLRVKDLTTIQGKGSAQNFARKTAMYYCQVVGNLPLKDIATAFEFSHIGGVSSAISSVKKQRSMSAISNTMQLIEADLNSEKQT